MSEPLEACPFCGSRAIRASNDGWGHVFHRCDVCKARGPARTISLRDPYPHPEAWNTRAAAKSA